MGGTLILVTLPFVIWKGLALSSLWCDKSARPPPFLNFFPLYTKPLFDGLIKISSVEAISRHFFLVFFLVWFETLPALVFSLCYLSMV